MKKTIVFFALLSMQLFSLRSLLEAQWSHDPTESQMVLYGSINHMMISDGLGGAIIAASVWVVHDYIVVQRIDRHGNILWNNTRGVPVALKGPQDDTVEASLLANGDGGVFVAYAYLDGSSFDADVYVQYIDNSGTTRWGDRGIPVCTWSGLQAPNGIVTDGEGGMIVVWRDLIESDVAYTYAQRLNREGELLWNPDGVFVSDRCLEILTTDRAGGVVLMPRSGKGGQRLSGDGTLLWNEEEIEVNVGYFREICSDGFGNIIMSGRKIEEGGYGLYVQKIDKNGSVLWGEGGIKITPTVDAQTFKAKIAIDAEGNAIFAWKDGRAGDSNIYTQKINSEGSIEWAIGGIEVSAHQSVKVYPVIQMSGSNEVICIWMDLRNEDQPDLYAQKLGEDGGRKWGPEDVAVNTTRNNLYDNTLISGENGSVITAWYYAAEVRGVYVALLDSFGILGGGSKGDLDGDGNIDIRDVLRLVNIILKLQPSPVEYELWSGDLNEDNTLDVIDVVLLVWKL